MRSNVPLPFDIAILNASTPRPASTSLLTDDQLIEKAQNAAGISGERFCRLFSGEWSGYSSRSEADFAFVGAIAFWTDDPEQILRIVRASGMNRDKWDRPDYAKRTIEKILANKTTGYDPTHYGRVPRIMFTKIAPPDPDNQSPGSPSPTDKGGFTNYYEVVVEGEGEKPKVNRIGFPITTLHVSLQRFTGNWPKVANSMLFVEGPDHQPRWIDSPAGYFAWIGGQLPAGERNGLIWAGGPDKVPQQQFHAYALQNAVQYDAVEPCPHYPPMARHQKTPAPCAN